MNSDNIEYLLSKELNAEAERKSNNNYLLQDISYFKK